MSWANRQIPRKRDLNQIPEALRPQIIPRAFRPEVIESESYQEISYNEVIINKRNSEPKKIEPSLPVTTRTNYVSKKIDSVSPPSAIELQFNDKSYVFIILRHIRNVRDNDLWISSYNSIRKYYINKIVIIDDNSSVNTVDGKLFNTEVIKSEFPGAGEILPYYYFLKFKWADRMIFIHDSMFINRPFRDSELEGDIKFHWFFEKSEIVDYRKINNYISLLKDNKSLQAFVADPDVTWRGCFGVTTICNYETIKYLEDTFDLFKTLVIAIKSRKDRESFERLFGIILYYEGMIEDATCSNFGNIIKYPWAFESNQINYETAANVLRHNNYDTAIIKVWRGR